MTSKLIKSLQENRTVRWLTDGGSRLPALIRRTLREPYQTTIDRLEANKDKEDVKTVELQAILDAKTALVESRTTNAQLRKDIRAVGGKPTKAEPEAAPVVKSRRA